MYDAVCVLSSAVRNRCVGVCTCSQRFSLTGLGLAPASALASALASGFWLLASVPAPVPVPVPVPVSTPIATPVQLLFLFLFLFLSWFLYRLQSCQTQVQALCFRSRSGSCMFRALPSSTPALGSVPIPVPCSGLVKLQLPTGSSSRQVPASGSVPVPVPALLTHVVM